MTDQSRQVLDQTRRGEPARRSDRPPCRCRRQVRLVVEEQQAAVLEDADLPVAGVGDEQPPVRRERHGGGDVRIDAADLHLLEPVDEGEERARLERLDERGPNDG